MIAAIKTTSRKRWEQILAQYPAKPAFERRRGHRRRTIKVGTVKLTADDDATPWTGALLNASPDGVLVKQPEGMADGTRVLLHIKLGNGEATLNGQAIYSTKTAGGFKVGIQLVFAGMQIG